MPADFAGMASGYRDHLLRCHIQAKKQGVIDFNFKTKKWVANPNGDNPEIRATNETDETCETDTGEGVMGGGAVGEVAPSVGP